MRRTVTHSIPWFFSLLAIGLLAAFPHRAAAQQTFVVERSGSFTADAPDDNPGDGICATSSGDCTFIAAIQEANADPDDDTIEFADTFNPTSSTDHNFLFPDETIRITEPVTIDGLTAPQFEQGTRLGVTLYSQADPGSPGIVIEPGGAGTTILGVAVVNYPGDGFVVNADDVTIGFCYAGIIDDAISSQPNDGAGVRVESGTNVLIGQLGLRGGPNVIGDNDGDGIVVEGGTARVGGNIVGLRPNGTTSAANGGVGIRVSGGTAHEIGFTEDIFDVPTTYGNVVSAHLNAAGVLVDADGHSVQGNIVGLTPDETAGRPNQNGIVVQGANNIIGPASRGEASNVVAANQGTGILLGASTDPADDNLIQNNYVGVTRTTDLNPGQNIGIGVVEGQDNELEGNIVGANEGGISVTTGVFRTILRDNYVGTNPSGADLGNLKDGIVAATAPSQLSISTRIVEGNVIGHTANGPGVVFVGEYNGIAGSFIGTNPDGDDLGNGGPGILVEDNPNALIGEAGIGNVIGFNDGPGILLRDTRQVTVQANKIGTDASGRDLGNNGPGILIEATAGAASDDNLIGYDVGATLPDAAMPDAGNRIAFNGGAGIELSGAENPLRNTMRGNTTSGNDGIAIDLGGDGVDGEDGGDGDSGANNKLNAPTIDAASTYNPSSGEIEVEFEVDCDPANCDYGSDGLTVDFYVTTEGDEAGRYVGTVLYPQSAAGTFVTETLQPPASANVQQTDQLVGVTTTARGNSSELPEIPDVLPVELTQFEARPNGKRVMLTWQTLSETGNDRFVVEHSAPEAETFTALGAVDGQGTTTEATDYRFETGALPAGTHTFRLKQVDLDGSSHRSDPITARIQMQADLSLEAPSPNPVRDQVTLSFGIREAQPVRLTLYDLLGRKVSTLYDGTPTPGKTQTIKRSVRDLPSGRYFVRLETGARPIVQTFTVIR